jgi:hypothetical protein
VIGKVTKDMGSEDTTGLITAFKHSKGLKYNQDKEITIFDWQILGPILATDSGKTCSIKKSAKT